ncbi:hypothetical protein K461DRAFT_292621 [Myriangium duriaei CBS 260.36]|uniref:C2H2-type domain-containing protein n=1 Tax=Myriangium duriaei CBS 260.36 TaxID=1168546 RepID=A0A9P4J376_9PEZI|nr:hypothetical protein K461DRAFT_292621 [Myriangium duriaei CBS 260.36]
MSDASGTSRTSPPPRQSSPNSLTDPTSPRLKVAVQRASPQTNQNDQFICTVLPECSSLTFNRKCEWSKHMDKHDRPYRCKDPVCAKLQGFTYSGGLLRHEREVHNKHGGPKEKLQCPFETCKRHDGHGFTRKENLAEHIRRVHEKLKSDPSIRTETVITTAWSAATELSPQAISATSTKRRWSDVPSPDPSESDNAELRGEIKRLKHDNVQLQEQMDKLRVELDTIRKEARSAATAGFRAA